MKQEKVTTEDLPTQRILGVEYLRCEWCGDAVSQLGTRTPRKHCKRSHRQRAYDARRHGEPMLWQKRAAAAGKPTDKQPPLTLDDVENALPVAAPAAEDYHLPPPREEAEVPELPPLSPEAMETFLKLRSDASLAGPPARPKAPEGEPLELFPAEPAVADDA